MKRKHWPSKLHCITLLTRGRGLLHARKLENAQDTINKRHKILHVWYELGSVYVAPCQLKRDSPPQEKWSNQNWRRWEKKKKKKRWIKKNVNKKKNCGGVIVLNNSVGYVSVIWSSLILTGILSYLCPIIAFYRENKNINIEWDIKRVIIKRPRHIFTIPHQY